MPGIESFSKAGGVTRALRVPSFTLGPVQGGAIQVYGETPQAQQAQIYQRIQDVHSPLQQPPVDELPYADDLVDGYARQPPIERPPFNPPPKYPQPTAQPSEVSSVFREAESTATSGASETATTATNDLLQGYAYAPKTPPQPMAEIFPKSFYNNPAASGATSVAEGEAVAEASTAAAAAEAAAEGAATGLLLPEALPFIAGAFAVAAVALQAIEISHDIPKFLDYLEPKKKGTLLRPPLKPAPQPTQSTTHDKSNFHGEGIAISYIWPNQFGPGHDGYIERAVYDYCIAPAYKQDGEQDGFRIVEWLVNFSADAQPPREANYYNSCIAGDPSSPVSADAIDPKSLKVIGPLPHAKPLTQAEIAQDEASFPSGTPPQQYPQLQPQPKAQTRDIQPGGSHLPGGNHELYYMPDPAAPPNEQNKRKPINLKIPPNTPVSISSGNQPPTTIITPPGKPSTLEIDRKAGDKDNKVPITIKLPSVIGNEPPDPITITPPSNKPTNIDISGSERIIYTPKVQQPTVYPGNVQQPTVQNTTVEPTVYVPQTQIKNAPSIQGATPALLEPDNYAPRPTGQKLTRPPLTMRDSPPPVTEPQTKVKPQTQSEKNKQTPPSPFLSPDNDLTHVLEGIVGISAILKGIQQQTSQENLKKAAAAGVCQTAEPGGCMNNLANEAAGNAEKQLENFLDKFLGPLNSLINLAANAAELALLRPILNIVTTINTKLGEVPIVGGISGFLNTFRNGFDKFVQWSKPGRLLNILTFLIALHNAFMLSQGVKQTLVQVIEDWLKVVEPFFGIDPDKTPLDLNKLIYNSIEGFFESLLGKEKVKQYEELFKSLNRIYQAATNLLNNIQMLFFSMTMALEIIGQNISSIGNALKKYGVVGHHAFGAMNPNPNFKNKWIGAIDSYTHKIIGFIAGAFAIDQIAQGILGGRQAVDQIAKEKDELQTEMYKAYGETTNIISAPEHKATADAASKAEVDSKGAKPDVAVLDKL